MKPDLRDSSCKRSRPTHSFDPSHLPRLLRLVLLILLSTLVNVADEALVVAFVLETGLVQDARLWKAVVSEAKGEVRSAQKTRRETYRLVIGDEDLAVSV